MLLPARCFLDLGQRRALGALHDGDDIGSLLLRSAAGFALSDLFVLVSGSLGCTAAAGVFSVSIVMFDIRCDLLRCHVLGGSQFISHEGRTSKANLQDYGEMAGSSGGGRRNNGFGAFFIEPDKTPSGHAHTASTGILLYINRTSAEPRQDIG